jgi:ligand-binding sensor domain-containing protein
VKRLAALSVALIVAALAGPARPASGDWNVFVNASAVNRIVCLGDSIWCATRGGILIFDRRDSTFVQHLDGLGFKTSDVSGLVRDDQGSVWAAFTSSGVARIDHLGSNPFVKLYSAAIDGLASDSVTCIVAAGEDVYYGSMNGVAKFFDGIPSFEPHLTDSLEGVPVHDLLVRGDTLWVGCDKGVVLFLRSALSFRLFPIGKVTSFCVHGGAIHCAGERGVQRFNGNGWLSMGLPDGTVPFAVASGSSTLYAITSVKVYVWSGSAWTSITKNLSSMYFAKYRIGSTKTPLRTIAVDSRDILWVAGFEETYNRGTYLSAYVNGFWLNKAPEYLSQNNIISLTFSPRRGVWASTRYFGISFRSNENQWVEYTKMRSPTDDRGLSYFSNHTALLFDSQGYLWCNALNYDLDRIKVNDPLNLDDDEWTHFALNTGKITSNRFIKAKEDPAGNRWFLSDDDLRDQGELGINILSADGSSWLAVLPATGGLAGGNVWDCTFDPSGVVYVALKGYGLQAWYPGGFDWANLRDFSNDIWRTLIGPDDLASKDLFAVELGADGSVWLGTASGLYRYASGAIDSITVKTKPGERGLVGVKAMDLEFDSRGNLWISTEQGLNRMDPDGVIDAFTTADAWQSDLYPSSIIVPLPSAQCGALYYDPDADVLWIGTANGLARLDVSPPVKRELPLARIVLYPNPVYIARGDQALRIARISRPVSIRVYTLEGELVHEVDGVVDGGVAWDLLTLNGFKARSGIYIVRVSDGRSFEVRKIGIVR